MQFSVQCHAQLLCIRHVWGTQSVLTALAVLVKGWHELCPLLARSACSGAFPVIASSIQALSSTELYAFSIADNTSWGLGVVALNKLVGGNDQCKCK